MKTANTNAEFKAFIVFICRIMATEKSGPRQHFSDAPLTPVEPFVVVYAMCCTLKIIITISRNNTVLQRIIINHS